MGWEDSRLEKDQSPMKPEDQKELQDLATTKNLYPIWKRPKVSVSQIVNQQTSRKKRTSTRMHVETWALVRLIGQNSPKTRMRIKNQAMCGIVAACQRPTRTLGRPQRSMTRGPSRRGHKGKASSLDQRKARDETVIGEQQSTAGRFGRLQRYAIKENGVRARKIRKKKKRTI